MFSVVNGSRGAFAPTSMIRTQRERFRGLFRTAREVEAQNIRSANPAQPIVGYPSPTYSSFVVDRGLPSGLRTFAGGSTKDTPTAKIRDSIRGATDALLGFFDQMDADDVEFVEPSLLDAGLDSLSSRLPGFYTLALALKDELANREDSLVSKDEWEDIVGKVLENGLLPRRVEELSNSFNDIDLSEVVGTSTTRMSSMSTLLPELRKVVKTLDQGQVERKLFSKNLFGGSLLTPDLLNFTADTPIRLGGLLQEDSEGTDDERAHMTPLQKLEEDHLNVFMRFFKNLDVEGDGYVLHGDLEEGLDALFSRAPSYFELTSKLLEAIGGETKASVHKEEWARVCEVAMEDMLASMPGEIESAREMYKELEKAVTALDQSKVKRKARRRMILGRSIDMPSLGADEFPKQRLEGVSTKKLQTVGVHRFENILEGYSFLDALGAGAFAKVFLVKNDKTGDIQAMKRIDRKAMQKACQITKEEVLTRIEHEFRHLQHTDHPHIIKLFEFSQDARFSYFVMEAANGGDLSKVVDHAYGRVRRPFQKEPPQTSKLSEAYIALVLEQTVYALHDLHKEGRIHKDVKLENLMLRNKGLPPHVVLIDLGFMEMLPEGAGDRLMPAGTPNTMAPEVIETYLGRKNGFDERCDIFSMGVVLFELLTGKAPYEVAVKGPPGPRSEIDYEGMLDIIKSLDVETPLLEAGRSSGAAELVKLMCNPDPEQRPTALECLRHLWLVKQGERRKSRPVFETSRDLPTLVDPSDARRAAVASQVQSFARRSALQRAAAYHLAAQVPITRLRTAQELLADIQGSMGSTIQREDMAQRLQSVLGVEEACARYVAAHLDMEDSRPEDFATFSKDCTELCLKRETAVLAHLATALRLSGDRGLTLGEVLGVLERFRGGRVSADALEEWLAPALKKGRDGVSRLTKEGFKECFDPEADL